MGLRDRTPRFAFLSPWRPVQAAAAEQVQMDMPDALAGAVIAVKDHAVSRLGDAGLPRQLLGDQEHPADELVVLGREVVEGSDVPAR